MQKSIALFKNQNRHPYLKSTFLIDFQHSEILRVREKIVNENEDSDPRSYAIAAFYFVRDSIKYRVTQEFLQHITLRASHTLKRGYGHCVAKAILYTALLRAYKIPCRMHFVDLYNHRLTATWKELWGDKLLWHGYVEILLEGRWIAANPAFDKELCENRGYPVVNFNGFSDALFAKYDQKGHKFMEYQKDHGTYGGVPYFQMVFTWMWHYGPSMVKNLIKSGIKRKNMVS